MEEDNTWLKVIALIVCVFILSTTGCNVGINYDNNRAMELMVTKGADPMDARCAVKGLVNTVCAIRATTKALGHEKN